MSFMYQITIRSYEFLLKGYSRANTKEEAIKNFMAVAIKGAIEGERLNYDPNRGNNPYFNIDIPYFSTSELTDSDKTVEEVAKEHLEKYLASVEAISLPFVTADISDETVFVEADYYSYNAERGYMSLTSTKFYTNKGRLV